MGPRVNKPYTLVVTHSISLLCPVNRHTLHAQDQRASGGGGGGGTYGGPGEKNLAPRSCNERFPNKHTHRMDPELLPGSGIIVTDPEKMRVD